MKSYLEIGKIVTLHGLRGDVKVQPWCDDAEFLCEFPVLYLGKEKKEVEVSHARPQKNMVLLHLEGYDTPEQAETLRNQIFYLNREDVFHSGFDWSGCCGCRQWNGLWNTERCPANRSE